MRIGQLIRELGLLPGYGGWVYACSVLLLDDDDELAEVAGADETAFAASLGVEAGPIIDARLLRHVSSRQRKVALVISHAIDDGGFEAWSSGCVEFHTRRVIALAEAGFLEAFGNLRKPRWSEVCLPNVGNPDTQEE